MDLSSSSCAKNRERHFVPHLEGLGWSGSEEDEYIPTSSEDETDCRRDNNNHADGDGEDVKRVPQPHVIHDGERASRTFHSLQSGDPSSFSTRIVCEEVEVEAEFEYDDDDDDDDDIRVRCNGEEDGTEETFAMSSVRRRVPTMVFDTVTSCIRDLDAAFPPLQPSLENDSNGDKGQDNAMGVRRKNERTGDDDFLLHCADSATSMSDGNYADAEADLLESDATTTTVEEMIWNPRDIEREDSGAPHRGFPTLPVGRDVDEQSMKDALAQLLVDMRIKTPSEQEEKNKRSNCNNNDDHDNDDDKYRVGHIEDKLPPTEGKDAEDMSEEALMNRVKQIIERGMREIDIAAQSEENQRQREAYYQDTDDESEDNNPVVTSAQRRRERRRRSRRRRRERRRTQNNNSTNNHNHDRGRRREEDSSTAVPTSVEEDDFFPIASSQPLHTVEGGGVEDSSCSDDDGLSACVTPKIAN